MNCPTPRKRRYLTEELAWESWDRNPLPDKELQSPYLCSCGMWHMTTMENFFLKRERGNNRWSVVRKISGKVMLKASHSKYHYGIVPLTRDDVDELTAALYAALEHGEQNGQRLLRRVDESPGADPVPTHNPG